MWREFESQMSTSPKGLNVTELNESSYQRHNRHHNDGKVTSLGSLLGMPVELSNGIAVQKTQNQQYKPTYTSLWGIQPRCLGGFAWETEPKQLSTGVVCWISIRINIGLI